METPRGENFGIEFPMLDNGETYDGAVAWKNLRECAGVNVAVFYPKSDDDPALEAKEYCNRCEVKAECLDYAMKAETTQEAYGVFGSLTAKERRTKKRRDGDRERRELNRDMIKQQYS